MNESVGGKAATQEMACYLSCPELHMNLTVYEETFHPCNSVARTRPKPEIRRSKHPDTLEAEIEDFLRLRNELVDSIRHGKPCQCDGCYEIKMDSYPQDYKIKITHFGIMQPCQCKCIYCWNSRTDENYAFQDFDFVKLIKTLERKDVLSGDAMIILAGGEPTLDPNINEMLDAVAKYSICADTNAVKYVEKLGVTVANAGPDSSINISVDSGTPKTYKTVKGIDAHDQVWRNIQRYAESGARVDLKYIFLDDNCNDADLNGFVEKAMQAGVSGIELSADVSRKGLYSRSHIEFMVKMLDMFKRNGVKAGFKSNLYKPEDAEMIREVMAGHAQ